MLKAHTTTACGVCVMLASRVYLGLGNSWLQTGSLWEPFRVEEM